MSTAPADSASAAGKRALAGAAEPMPQKEKSLGTGHGRRETSSITYTDFERESSRPYEVVSVWYDSRTNLVARGIIPRPPRHDPQPFPEGFVPDPPAHR